MVRAWTSRRLLTAVCILALATSILVGAAVTSRTNATPAGSPTVAGNFLVDQDQNLQFPQNKQNEPAITRDPLTGMLIVGANDELEQPPWHNHPWQTGVRVYDNYYAESPAGGQACSAPIPKQR